MSTRKLLGGLLLVSIMPVAHAASSHLGVIPFENMVDMSFRNDGPNQYTKVLREAGAVVSTVQNGSLCFTLARTAVIMDVQMQVVVANPNSQVNGFPAIVASKGANLPIVLVQGRGTGAAAGESDFLSQNFVGGKAFAAGTTFCMFDWPNAMHNWSQAEISGYYPVK